MTLKEGYLFLLCGFVTWLPRIIPFIFSKKMSFPPRVQLFLNYLPVTILAALFFQSLLTFEKNQWPILKIPEVIACIPTLIVGYYTKDLMKIVITGMISIAILRLSF